MRTLRLVLNLRGVRLTRFCFSFLCCALTPLTDPLHLVRFADVASQVKLLTGAQMGLPNVSTPTFTFHKPQQPPLNKVVKANVQIFVEPRFLVNIDLAAPKKTIVVGLGAKVGLTNAFATVRRFISFDQSKAYTEIMGLILCDRQNQTVLGSPTLLAPLYRSTQSTIPKLKLCTLKILEHSTVTAMVSRSFIHTGLS